MIDRTMLLSLYLLTCLEISSAKPSQNAEPGPCIGMDCLHGVLMHNDEEQGTDHNTEDQYLRFKEVLKTEEELPGPRNAEEEFHGVLMHGDSEAGHQHTEGQEMLPQTKKEIQPKDLTEVVHEGMHGQEGTHKHEWDNKDDQNENKNAGDHEKVMHGILMHGDENHDKNLHDTESVDEINEDNGPLDHDKLMHGLLMHGDEHHGDHDTDENENDIEPNEVGGPSDHGKIMHGLLMHGDKDYNEEEPDETDEGAKDIGPKDAGEFLHGVLMHGDDKPGKVHSHNARPTEQEEGKISGPSSDQLHGILMHGDSEFGHDHSEEDASSEYEVFSDISKILEMDLEEDLLKVIDLEKILRKDIEEYAEWVENNPKHQDENTMGSTYIDRSILDDIELMKQRYLNRDDDDDDKNSDDLVNDVDDDIPFTAEDANSVLGEGAMAGEGEDMRHDLELMGSTDPINSRHHIKLELQKEANKKK